MITVAGEALIDIVPDGGGLLSPHVGGAPFNVARLTAQLGAPTTYLGRLSEDPRGRQLAEALTDAGVTLALPESVATPSPLAMVALDATGSADYSFYFEGTAGVELEAADVPAGLLSGGDVLVLGGLGIVYEPVASTLLGLVRSAPDDVTVVLDPNCRPQAIGDMASYRRRFEELVTRTDLLKLSAEDLAILLPGASIADAGIELRQRGPAVVLITDGPRAVLTVTAAGVRSTPVPPAPVVDTIGAGDGFLSGVLVWLAAGLRTDVRSLDADALDAVVSSAIAVSTAVCSVAGAALPPGFALTP